MVDKNFYPELFLTVLQSLFKRRLIFISGKGGTGKSLLSGALACEAARFGKRILVVEANSSASLPGFFGKQAQGQQLIKLRPQIDSINLSSERCWRDYTLAKMGSESLYRLLFSSQLFQSFVRAIPGLLEVMLLGWLVSKCSDDLEYDLVIFDAPASGHFLSLMHTPDSIIATGIGGPIVKKLIETRDFLKNPALCGTVVVARPEGLIQSETLELIPEVENNIGLSINLILLNAFNAMPELDSLQEQSAIRELKPALDYIEQVGANQLREQQNFEQRLRKDWGRIPYLIVPYLENFDGIINCNVVNELFINI